MIKKYPGINIQFPISRFLLTGEKTIETRTYACPKKYVGTPLALVETPGKSGDFKARVVGLIVFGESFKYVSERDFYAQTDLHKVTPESPWHWKSNLGKWGWPVQSVEIFSKPRPVRQRLGIRFTKQLSLKT